MSFPERPIEFESDLEGTGISYASLCSNSTELVIGVHAEDCGIKFGEISLCNAPFNPSFKRTERGGSVSTADCCIYTILCKRHEISIGPVTDSKVIEVLARLWARFQPVHILIYYYLGPVPPWNV
jgi:hypothetical protein